MFVLPGLEVHSHSFLFHLDSVMTWPLDRNFMAFDWMEGSVLDPFFAKNTWVCYLPHNAQISSLPLLPSLRGE